MAVYDESAMDFLLEVDASDVTEDNLYAGSQVTKEGHYHVSCTTADVEAEETKLKCLKLTMEILAGEHEDQVDRQIYHRVYMESWDDRDQGVKKPLDVKAYKGIIAFAYAFGLIQKSDFGKKGLKIPFHQIEGRQAVVKVSKKKDWSFTDDQGVKQTRSGGLGVEWNSDAWPVFHERVKDVPKDTAAMGMLMDEGGESTGDDDLGDI